MQSQPMARDAKWWRKGDHHHDILYAVPTFSTRKATQNKTAPAHAATTNASEITNSGALESGKPAADKTSPT